MNPGSCFALLVLTTSLAGASAAIATERAATSPSPGIGATTAVLDFEAVGATREEASATTDRMQEELLKLGGVKLVDRSQVSAVLNEQAFQQAVCPTAECAVRVGQVLGARQLVSGKLTRLDKTHWVVAANLIAVETTETLTSASVDIEGDIFAVLNQGVPHLAARLAAPPQPAPPPALPAPGAASPTATTAVEPANPKPRGPFGGFSFYGGSTYHTGTLRSQIGALSYESLGGFGFGIDYQFSLGSRVTLVLAAEATTSVQVAGSITSVYDQAAYSFAGAELRYWPDDRWFLGFRGGNYTTIYHAVPTATDNLRLFGIGYGVTGGFAWRSGWYAAGSLDLVSLLRSSAALPTQVNGNADEVGLWLNLGYRFW